MNNLSAWKVIVFVIMVGFFCQSIALAGWELYDDFSAGSIDTSKWSVDDSSATITVEGGRAKFVHNSGNPNDTSSLGILDSPETIAAIKATVNVDSCVGGDEVRIRLTSFIGILGSNFIFKSLELRPWQDRILAAAYVLGPPPDYNYIKDYFWGSFRDPANQSIVGATYTLSTTQSYTRANYTVAGQGELEYVFPDVLTPVAPVEENFSSLSTRSGSGVGTCTIYFDDVYIMRKKGFNWSAIVPIISNSRDKKQ